MLTCTLTPLHPIPQDPQPPLYPRKCGRAPRPLYPRIPIPICPRKCGLAPHPPIYHRISTIPPIHQKMCGLAPRPPYTPGPPPTIYSRKYGRQLIVCVRVFGMGSCMCFNQPSITSPYRPHVWRHYVFDMHPNYVHVCWFK